MRYLFVQNGPYWWVIRCKDINIHSMKEEKTNFDLLYTCTEATQLAFSKNELVQTESNELPFSSAFDFIEYNSLENLLEEHLVDVI